MNVELLDIIKSRRSIRKYLPSEVPREAILRILEAARYGPSAHNAQPWRFIVIMERALKGELAEAMAAEWLEEMERDGVLMETRESLVRASIEQFTDAPVLIVACVAMEDMDRYPDERRQECERVMAVQSLAAAIQNMLLVTHHEGLGACWFCAPLFCQDTVRKVLGIPKDVEPHVLITLGYPSEKPSPPPRKAIEEIAYIDHWGEKP